jgi:hypothetical protein
MLVLACGLYILVSLTDSPAFDNVGPGKEW